MTTPRDSQRSIAAWLDSEVPDRAPARLIEASRERVRATSQRDVWWQARTDATRGTFARLGLATVAVVAVSVVALTVLRAPSVGPGAELGIFEPLSGRIVSGQRQGFWVVNPNARRNPATLIQLTSPGSTPLGWSSDGTRLLLMRDDPEEGQLFVLNGDGTETAVTDRPMGIRSASMSPDGSRVVFHGGTGAAIGGNGVCCQQYGLYVVDTDGGPAQLIVEGQDGMVQAPTFSPDGTKIAYTYGAGDHSNSVWMMNADGSDAHEIVSNADVPGHVKGLQWSPAGDRIALGLEGSIYTFAPDGSNYTRVIAAGNQPYWSPDGSRLAYTVACVQSDIGCGMAVADADGSNVVRFGTFTSGPWHPGTLANDAGG